MKNFLLRLLINILYIMMFVLMLNVVSFFIGLITDNLYIISGLSFFISSLLIWIIIKNKYKINEFLGNRK